nr:AAA family ATPase [Thiothrix nivea]
MKIPYGISNFKDLITGGYVYIDKTAYIAKLEDSGRYHILLRPRRFGKSLLLSSLWHYYDVRYQNEFEAIFGKLRIGQHPTPLKSRYQVLFMEFSGISTESHEAIYRAFNTTVRTALQSFLLKYQYPQAVIDEVNRQESPHEKMRTFFEAMQVQEQKILLLIDEYDHFANSILADDLKLFQHIVGKGGFVRSFYETLKTATLTGVIDRMFITGVTPVMLDSMTSGFNIGENISLDEAFNSAVGFTKAETASLLQPLAEACQLDAPALMADITAWYNGYRFHIHAPETVYNADMVLYFVKGFDFQRCRYPKYMLNENIASDYGKILGMFSIGDRDANFAVLDELISTGTVTAQQRRKFDFEKGFDRDDFISLLAYMGFVTLQDESPFGEVFTIPNHVIRELYYQYFKVELERRNQITISTQDLRLALEALAMRDDFQPLADEMARAMQALSNRDAMGMDEKHLKVLLLTLLYQVPVYFIHSEREMNRAYPDILLLERNPISLPHQHLIELKYSKKADGDKGWESKRADGIRQVQGYLQLPAIAALPKLSAWLLVSDGVGVEVVKVQ